MLVVRAAARPITGRPVILDDLPIREFLLPTRHGPLTGRHAVRRPKPTCLRKHGQGRHGCSSIAWRMQQCRCSQLASCVDRLARWLVVLASQHTIYGLPRPLELVHEPHRVVVLLDVPKV